MCETSRNTVSHLLRPVGNVGLLHESGLPRVFQGAQSLQSRPTRRLRLDSQHCQGLRLRKPALGLCPQRQIGEHSLQCNRLGLQHVFRVAQVSDRHPRVLGLKVLQNCKSDGLLIRRLVTILAVKL